MTHTTDRDTTAQAVTFAQPQQNPCGPGNPGTKPNAGNPCPKPGPKGGVMT